MELNENEGMARWTPEQRMKELPYAVAWLSMGAQHNNPHKGMKDVVGLELDGEFFEMSLDDWNDVARVYDDIDNMRAGSLMSGRELLRRHRMALDIVEKEQSGASKSIVMLKDKSGAGYWRMILPSRGMSALSGMDEVRVDITSSEVKFDSLLEYDTIFVQRLHDWESYYILKKLKEAGRKVVYDIDDDIFSLTPDNPAFHVIGRDNQIAARECMKLADVVTTTTDVLAQRLYQVADGDIEPVVIPNSMNPEGWMPTELTGSPDKWKRIFWQGSATHEVDWEVCIDAVDSVLQERKDVRLVILGSLPKVIQERVNLPHWHGRIEYMGFSDTETYFQIVRHLRADVGLAPLVNTPFNEAKSPIKWMENALIGMPTVASAGHPYSDVIEDGKSGRVVPDDVAAWKNAIDGYLDDKDLRLRAVAESRKRIADEFDIRKVAESWKCVMM